MKLSSMAKRDIRCVVVKENSTVVKYNKQESIDLVMKNYNADRMVTIFNPKLDEKQTIANILDESTKDGKVQVSGLSFLKLMSLVTDIDIADLTEEEGLEIVNNPNDVLEAVNVELNRLFIGVIKQRYETMETLNSLPEPLLKDVLEGEIKKAEAEEEAKKLEEERLAKIEEEKAELEARLKALESQK